MFIMYFMHVQYNPHMSFHPPPTSSRSDCSGLDSGSSLKLVECEVE
uniref:Uncharacterized protein n=1 Tax=Amphimedon queenslandica TaxID=400682 RepID=A0A1X7U4D2_AMPQE